MFWLLFVWTSRRKRVGWRRSGHSASKELEPVLDLVRPTQDRHRGAAKSILSSQNHFFQALRKQNTIFRCRCCFVLWITRTLVRTIPSLQWCPLLRSGHENLNWMLLGPKADWLGRRGTVSAAKQLLEPTAGDGGCSWRMWGYMVWAWNRVILMLRWLEINLWPILHLKGGQPCQATLAGFSKLKKTSHGCLLFHFL